MDKQRLERELERRRLELCRRAASRGYDAVLVIGRSPERAGNLFYLCHHRPGVSGHPSSYRFRGRGYGALLLPLDDAPILFSTSGFYQQPIGVPRVEIGTDMPGAIARVVGELGLSRGVIGLVGMDIISVTLYRHLTRLLPTVRFEQADDLVLSMRAIKSPYELELLRTGSAVADEVADKVRDFIRPGLTEREIFQFMVQELQSRGVENAGGTCQSGLKRTAEPVSIPPVSDRVVEAGDMLHMEFNGLYGGYQIDICRSTVVGRPPTPEQKDMLELIVLMLEQSIAAVRPGVAAETIELVAGRIALERGLGKHHSVAYGGPASYVGHAIGVGSDELPLLAVGEKTPLEENMVLTIEPGLYRMPVGGARVEDEVLVTADGVEVLTKVERRWW